MGRSNVWRTLDVVGFVAFLGFAVLFQSFLV